VSFSSVFTKRKIEVLLATLINPCFYVLFTASGYTVVVFLGRFGALLACKELFGLKCE
jgi:hypothetical protein